MALHKSNKEDDSWLGVYWKPAAAIVYLLICVFDFIIVPTYLGLWAPKLSEIIMAVKDLPPDAQIIVLNLKLATWDPLTLKGGGLFHVAFGAILGATVWSRGQERINEIRQGWGGPQDYQYQQYQQPQMQGMVNQPQVNNNVQNPQLNGAQIDNPDQNG